MATCPICFEEIKQKASPDSCDHLFCLSCLEKWSKLGSFCPVDRKRYKKIVNLELDSFVQVKSRKRKKSRVVYDFSAKCEICEDENKPEVLLMCDCCDLAFHTYCLSPPLKIIPAGQWFCPTCTSVEKKLREKNGITKEVEVDLGNSKLFPKGGRHRKRTKEKLTEVSHSKHNVLPSCSRISDESIKERNKKQRRKYSTMHTSQFQPQIKLEDGVLTEEEYKCCSNLLKPVKIILKKEDQDICENYVTGITKFPNVSQNEADGLSFVNRRNLQHLTIRDDGSFYLDVDSASTKCTGSMQDRLSKTQDSKFSAFSNGSLVTKFSKLKNGHWTVNSNKMLDLVDRGKEKSVLHHNRFNNMSTSKSYQDVDNNRSESHSKSFLNYYSCKGFYSNKNCNHTEHHLLSNNKEGKTLSPRDLKHLNIRNDGTFFLDSPTSVDIKPDLEALQNTSSTSSKDESSNRQAFRHNDLRHLNIRSDGTFFLDSPTSEDTKSALHNSSSSSEGKSSQCQEFTHNNLKQSNIGSDGTFFLDIKPDLGTLQKALGTFLSGRSLHHQELNNNLKHLNAVNCGTSPLDNLASTSTKHSLGVLHSTCDTSSGNECVNHHKLDHCSSEHFSVEKKDETSSSDSLTSVDIKPDLKTLQNASSTSLGNESLRHQHLRHLTIRSDGTFFLDIPDIL